MIYELPPQAKGTAEQQLADLREYLFRLTKDLDRISNDTQLNIVSTSDKALTKAEQKSVADIRQQAETLKALIIKTADEVEMYADELVTNLSSVYVAQSEFGSYYNVIETNVRETAEAEISSYEYKEGVTLADGLEAAEAYYTELNGQIRKGVIYDADNNPHIGIAISEELEVTGTTTIDGIEYPIMSNEKTYGLYTASGWEFWLNGAVIGYFSSTNEGTLHVINIVADKSYQIGSDWLFTATNGFGIKYIGDTN